MTGDKKDPTIDENLARIRELVESVKKPESNQQSDSGDTSHGGSSHGDEQGSQNPADTPTPQPLNQPLMDEGAEQNLARKGAVDSASRTPLTDYVTQNMPHYLDTPNPAPKNPQGHVDSLPTADNGFNEPFTKASVSPIDGDEKPAPFVTGVSSQQIKSRQDADTDDEIPQVVMDALLQSDEKGKVHIRSGVNAPAFTSPHNVQVSINRDNRRTLDEIAKNPAKKMATVSKSGNAFAELQAQKVEPAGQETDTVEPLVLTDVLTLDDVVEDDGVEQPPTAVAPTPPTPPTVDIPDGLRKPTPQPTKQTAPDESVPEESVLIRIRSAMEHLKQVQIEKEPFDTAVRDMVETEVRPYVKKWVNDNIADVVERQVDTQIQKILNKI